MAATAEGKTSMRPHWRDWMRAVVDLPAVGEAIRGLMVQFTSALQPPRGFGRSSDPSTPSRKVTHGQTVRDLRQDAAVRTSRQPREEPGQPEVSAQPADGPRDRVGEDVSGQGLHAVLEDVLGVVPA